MSASWYDVLGVDPTASAEEIREVWKRSIADLEPTDRRFRACNQAAEVLLDPERRAAYDAKLAAEEAVEAPAPQAPAPGASEPAPTAEVVPEPVVPEPAALTQVVVPAWLLIALALAVAGVTALAAVFQFTGETSGDEVEATIVEARSAAESAMPKLFSYHYKTPERDRDQALLLTTGDFHDELQQVWDEGIMPNIREAKGYASSSLVASGVVRASDDADRVEIVVLLDTESGNAAGPVHIRLAFTATMEEVDGKWLVAEVSGWNPPASPSKRPGA